MTTHDDEHDRPLTEEGLRRILSDREHGVESKLHRTLDKRESLKKNGESFGRYFLRHLQVFIGIGTFCVSLTIGATIWVKSVDWGMAGLDERASVSEAAVEAINDRIDVLQASIDGLPAASQQDVREELSVIRPQLYRIEEAIKLKADRRDVNNAVDELRVRLTRIEEQYQQFMRGRGAGAGS